MVLVYSACKDGNGFAPYGSPMRFSDIEEAIIFVSESMFGRFLVYERESGKYLGLIDTIK